jgi:hypothetical protein
LQNTRIKATSAKVNQALMLRLRENKKTANSEKLPFAKIKSRISHNFALRENYVTRKFPRIRYVKLKLAKNFNAKGKW